MPYVGKSIALLGGAVMALSACDDGGQSSGNMVVGSVSTDSAPPPPPPPPPPNYAPAIDAVMLADGQTEAYGLTDGRVSAMRAIDMTQTPTDFREAYLEHIFAWERRLRAERAWNELTAEGNNGPILIRGIVCAAVGCAENPIDTRLEAEERVKEEISLAVAQVRSTFQDVQRIAVRHGASATPSQPVGNTTGM